MIYSSLKAEQLIPLRDALVDLMFFVEKCEDDNRLYFCRYLGYMKENIEICICTQEAWGEGLRYLNSLLTRDWIRANNEYLGIPSFDLFVKGQGELCLQYLGLLDKVERYFIPYMDCKIENRI